MSRKRFTHIILFTAAVLSLSIAVFAALSQDMTPYQKNRNSCLDIPIIPRQKLPSTAEYVHQDLSDLLRYCDSIPAIDTQTDTIYLPRSSGTQQSEDLPGTLSILNSSYHLLFLEDPLWQDLNSASAENHLFELLITSDGIHYMKYNVVFTTLPVLCMEGKENGFEEDLVIYKGNLCLQTPRNQYGKAPVIQESEGQWHLRGRTSFSFPHRPYKISLKKENGQNNHLNLLGMGADDDWILNPMYVDSLKVREKLFMELWNENVCNDSFNYPMSTGQYVEAVINGEYCGMYFLERRLDEKYLDLSEQDILLKGQKPHSPPKVEDAYRIIASPYSDEQTYSIVRNMCTDAQFHNVDLNNCIDVNLFIQFFSALDNAGYKNMFYLLREHSGKYTVTLIPWDTDLSMGMTWKDGYDLDYPYSLSWKGKRHETKHILEIHPKYLEHASRRWRKLRETVFQEDHILKKVDEIEAYLIQSGALLRDEAKWGKYFSSDSMEILRQYITDRLAWLDDLYCY